MTLQQCTKAELIGIIDKLKRRLLRFGDAYLTEALAEVERDRELSRISEAAKHSAASYASMLRYIELLKPFEGKNIADIPFDVVYEARECLAESKRHDKEWDRLIK